MNYKYKPGDIVKIRRDLLYSTPYKMLSGPDANKTALFKTDGTQYLGGRKLTIVGYSIAHCYLAKEYYSCPADAMKQYYISDEMIEDGGAGKGCFCSSLI